MTNREVANTIRGCWQYKLGLLAIRVSHPIKTFGKTLDMHPDEISKLAGHANLCFTNGVTEKRGARMLSETQTAAQQCERYGFDILIWIAVAELVIRLAILIWQRLRP